MVRRRSTVRFRIGARKWVGCVRGLRGPCLLAIILWGPGPQAPSRGQALWDPPGSCRPQGAACGLFGVGYGGVAQSVEQAAHNRCVAGSSPATATRVSVGERGKAVAGSDVRPKITLACEECKHRNYITKKNRRNDPDRMEMKKFCPNCGTHRLHKETR